MSSQSQHWKFQYAKRSPKKLPGHAISDSQTSADYKDEIANFSRLWQWADINRLKGAKPSQSMFCPEHWPSPTGRI